MKRRNLLKILGIAAVVGGLTPGFAVAAEAEVEPEARMVVELVTPISSESNQVGDAIRFKVVEALKIDDRILIEAGQELQGVVTVAQPSGRLGRAGRLGIEIKSEGLNGVELPLEIVRPSAVGAKGKLGVVRRVAAPLAKVGRTVLSLGGRDSVPGQAAHLAAVDPELARDLATRSTGVADPLAEVELASDSKGARAAKRGVKAVARIGGGYLNAILNGPAGALRRGGTIEVAAGARLLVGMK